MIRTVLLVGAGSCLGGIARLLIARLMAGLTPNTWPWGTLVANVAGCLVIGLVCGMSLRHQGMSPQLKTFLTVGFCGGFTTFSSFMNENFSLLHGEHPWQALAYTASSLVLGLIAVWCGYLLTRQY